jgi:Uncharacterized protein conserved in bacteria
MHKKSLLALAFGVAAVFGSGSVAAADNWPSRSINLIVGFSAGGPTDTASRVLAQELSAELGQTVVVDNKPGASGAIAERYLTSQPADGYNMLMLVVPTVLKRIFDNESQALAADVDPIARIYSHDNVLVVNPKYPGMENVRNVKDLVEVANKTSDSVMYTSSGMGSIGHLAGQRMANMANINVQHVSYKGSAPALNDTLGGQVPMMFGDYTTLLQHIKTGTIRPIAVASTERLEGLEEVPTLIEQGFEGLTAVPWGGLVVKKGTDERIKQKLQDALATILSRPAVQQKIKDAGLIAHYLPASEWKAQVERDFGYWKQVVESNNIKKE